MREHTEQGPRATGIARVHTYKRGRHVLRDLDRAFCAWDDGWTLKSSVRTQSHGLPISGEGQLHQVRGCGGSTVQGSAADVSWAGIAGAHIQEGQTRPLDLNRVCCAWDDM